MPVFETRRMGVLAGLLVAALLAAAAFATAASAETFVVNNVGDEAEEEACETITAPCSLRSAIEAANNDPGTDTIEFGVSGTIAIEGFPLPSINEAVTIDATTAPGYSGAPVVDIDGSEANNEGPVRGLEIFAGPTLVEGLAIGSFYDEAIYAESSQPVQICGDYLGTDLAGTEARPNHIGVEIGIDSTGAEIGAGCPGGKGNVISGNELFGVLDRGHGTEIAANSIGLDAAGGPLGNGGFEEEGPPPDGAGIYVADGAGETFIGPGAAGGAGNAIAFNEVAGVRVSEGTELVTIGENSIHSNVGPGIEYTGEAPAIPSLSSAEAKQSGTSVTGTLTGSASEAYFVEFFANQSCDENGSGEGQTPIGGLEVNTGSDGAVAISAHGLDPIPVGQTVITATATAIKGSTSEFSKCITATVIPPEEKKPPPAEVLPVNGQSVEVEPESGTILVQFPGQKKPHPLRKGEIIPVGTIVDATNGRVTLTSIDDEGHEQTAVFYGGKFQVFQQPGSTLVVLRLRGDGPGTGACKGAAGAGAQGRASATISRRRGRHLWGSGHGSFRTEGAHGSATVRGTIWFTEDRCDGTYFKTKSGIVTVRDFTKHRSVQVPAGQEYLAAKTP
jgi:hypothetical protein